MKAQISTPSHTLIQPVQIQQSASSFGQVQPIPLSNLSIYYTYLRYRNHLFAYQSVAVNGDIQQKSILNIGLSQASEYYNCGTETSRVHDLCVNVFTCWLESLSLLFCSFRLILKFFRWYLDFFFGCCFVPNESAIDRLCT